MFLPLPFTLVFHAVLLGVMYRWCSTCTVQKDSKANLLLDEIIARAVQYQEDDKVTLKFPQAVLLEKNDPAVIIRRPRLGQNVSFTCFASPEGNSRAISLTFQGQTLFQQGERLPVENVNNQRYHFAQYGDTLIFQVFNVTLQSTGEIVCYEGLVKKAVIRRYSLMPLITRAEEIFAQSLVPQNVTQGGSATFAVAVRMPLSQRVLDNLHTHCMWRHKGQWLSVPKEEPYTSSMPPTWIPMQVQFGRIPDKNTVGSLLYRFTFENVKPRDNGPVEFWFRPHRETHEWIYQSAKLNVL
ncbi:uncharacterized protein LOC129585299 isoform X1 [Paramacrobiotus metropolitanus]|uniref:uncharacterized protein LOC129585299 isoform X1 n=1 Tax=Paramacrobiotus metropolitanus TaxID=2943436 RepID=UPI002445C68C|nr:uncharacterized protein LOC129585299 isoform X1 [Paramacrobiotus metropolitanus]